MRRATEMASCVDFASHAWVLFDEVKGHFTRNHNRRSDSESTSVFAIKNDLNVNSAFFELSFHHGTCLFATLCEGSVSSQMSRLEAIAARTFKELERIRL